MSRYDEWIRDIVDRDNTTWRRWWKYRICSLYNLFICEHIETYHIKNLSAVSKDENINAMYHCTYIIVIVKRIANKCLLYYKVHYCKVFALFVRCRLFIITTLATIMIGRCKFVCPFVSNLFHQLSATSSLATQVLIMCVLNTPGSFHNGAWMAWHRW